MARLKTMVVYLDHAATSPIRPEVLQRYTEYLTVLGNPSSVHTAGQTSRKALEEAREEIARAIYCNRNEIIFTAGGTEADNLAIKGLFWAQNRKDARRKLVLSAYTEHHAVIDPIEWLEREQGAEAIWIPVDEFGVVDLVWLEAFLVERADEVALISLMWANNETGVIYPIKQIAEIAHRHGVLFHSDATQAVGKMQINVIEDEIDLLNFSGHKLYGPKGVGVLYVRKKLNIIAQQDGGKHERGMRSGTLNVTGIVGLGEAAEICQNSMSEEADRLSNLRNKLENGILEKLPNTKINGNIAQRLPNTTNICFGKIDGEQQ